MSRHPVSLRVDEAIDLLEQWGQQVAIEGIRANVRRKLTWADFSSDEAIDAVIDRHAVPRLKARGYIVSDSTPRTGGRERKLFWSATPDELGEQLRLKRESARYDENRIRADEAIIAFLRAKRDELGYEVYPGLFDADIERIYAMHGLSSPGR